MKRVLLALPCLSLVVSGCRIELPLADVRLQEEAVRAEVHALALAPGDVLTLLTEYGKIEVVALDLEETGGGRAELQATLRAHGRTAEEARAVLARYELRIERGPAGPRAELVGEPLRLERGLVHMELSAHVDFVATVPTGTKLAARSGGGDLVTRGALGALELESEYGAIQIDEARGDVRAKSGSGDIAAVRLVDGGEITLRSAYGDVRVQEARARRVSCQSGSGDIRVDSATADQLELETSYGSVHAGRAEGAVHARSGSGDVRLHGVNGAVEAESSYGTVEVDGVLSALAARSGSGTVHVRARAGSRIESRWTIESDYGDVLLAVPEGFACALDAETSYGTVACDFPVAIEAGQKKRDNALKGSLGSGGGTVTLSSGSGNILLKKL